MEPAKNIDEAISVVLQRAAEITAAFREGQFPEHECFEDGVQEMIANILKIDFSLFHGGALPRRWSFSCGAKVRTLQSRGRTDWIPVARRHCQWGVDGVVLQVKTGHGRVFEVRHADGSTAWYDHDEVQRTE